MYIANTLNRSLDFTFLCGDHIGLHTGKYTFIHSKFLLVSKSENKSHVYCSQSHEFCYFSNFSIESISGCNLLVSIILKCMYLLPVHIANFGKGDTYSSKKNVL